MSAGVAALTLLSFYTAMVALPALGAWLVAERRRGVPRGALAVAGGVVALVGLGIPWGLWVYYAAFWECPADAHECWPYLLVWSGVFVGLLLAVVVGVSASFVLSERGR